MGLVATTKTQRHEDITKLSRSPGEVPGRRAAGIAAGPTNGSERERSSPWLDPAARALGERRPRLSC